MVSDGLLGFVVVCGISMDRTKPSTLGFLLQHDLFKSVESDKKLLGRDCTYNNENIYERCSRNTRKSSITLLLLLDSGSGLERGTRARATPLPPPPPPPPDAPQAAGKLFCLTVYCFSTYFSMSRVQNKRISLSVIKGSPTTKPVLV